MKKKFKRKIQTVWPTDLAVFYPHRGLAPAWQLAGSAAALALVTVAAFRLRRGRPYVLAGWLWYLGTLVPVIGLVQVGKQSMADRYTYVPLIGIFVIVVWGAADAIGALARSRDGARGDAATGGPDPLWLLVPAFAVVLPLMAVTRAQLRHWRDSVTLFERAVAVAESDVAHANLGEALLSLDRNDEAEVQFRAALRMDPFVAEAHNGLGLILEGRGRLDEARQHYE
jgi:tetratricopeptide (TPR) repeat protein